MEKNFYKYSKLISLKIRGYYLDKILINDVHDIYSTNINSISLKHFLSNLINRVFFQNFEKALETHTLNIISVHQKNRDDYNELIDGYINKLKLKEYCKYDIDYERKKYFSIISILYILKVSLCVFKITKFTFKEKLFLVSKSIFYLNSLIYLEKKYPVFSKSFNYYSFNSSFNIDTLICQFLNRSKIETFSFQHAVYNEYRTHIPFDCVNYANITAKNMLSWSIFTKNLISKYSPNTSVIITGHPIYANKNYIRLRKESNKVLVLLAREIYDEKNFELLNILFELSISTKYAFYIKTHPNSLVINKKNQYKNDYIHFLENNKSLRETLNTETYRFAISFSTSSYFDALQYGYICFNYEPANDILPSIGLDFTNQTELLNKINQIETIKDDKYDFIGKNLLSNTLGI